MNVVCLSGTIHSAPSISWTKNGKPQTTFELTVPNEETPGYFTRESVLIVGGQAEPLCERLNAGDEVELTGKLQRGQVVCFKVHVRKSAGADAPQAPRPPDGDDPQQGDDLFHTPEPHVRRRPYPPQARLGGFAIK